jgi:hypothetical protein
LKASNPNENSSKEKAVEATEANALTVPTVEMSTSAPTSTPPPLPKALVTEEKAPHPLCSFTESFSDAADIQSKAIAVMGTYIGIYIYIYIYIYNAINLIHFSCWPLFSIN